MKGTLAVIIIGLMIIPFALFGVDSLFLQNGSTGNAAEVNGEKISEIDLSRAVRNQKQQLLERYGEQAPVELLSDENLREPVMSRLIQREVVQQSAVAGGMTVAEAQLDQLIVLSPQFQQSGKFDPDLYTQLLRSSGFTPASYKQLLAQDIVLRQHISGVSDSAFVTQNDLNALVALSQQTRTFEYLTLSQSDARQGLDVPSTEKIDYYDNNQALFMSTEKVSIDYIELSLSDLAESVDVSEQAIEDQYQENLKSFSGEILRQAAHILVEHKDDGSESNVISEIQNELSSGADFSSLVSKYSDDLGSKEMGGDLGVTDGSTFPDSFEAALAALAVGEVSGPITTDAGTHFITLLSEQKSEVPSLAETRDQIRSEIALAEADSLFVELLDELPEATYNSEDLSASAQELGLELKRTELFDRQGGVGIAQNNQVLALAFSQEMLEDRQVSDVVELSNDHVLVMRLAEHHISAVKPFDLVEADITEILTNEKVSAKLRARAVELETRLQNGASVEALAESEKLEWQAAIDVNRAHPGYPRELLGYVFSQAKPKDDATIGFTVLSEGNYAVIKLTGSKPGKLPEMASEQKQSLTNSVNQQQGSSELSLFEAEKRSAADVTIY